MPCEENGLCEAPLGASTIGLIYVNPAGPINVTGDPAESAHDVRRIFGNMGFNDRETVSLIGGGHAFGKVCFRTTSAASGHLTCNSQLRNCVTIVALMHEAARFLEYCCDHAFALLLVFFFDGCLHQLKLPRSQLVAGLACHCCSVQTRTGASPHCSVSWV